nr:DMT family transporter [Thaumasiovibrio subtropicus]
MEVPSSVLKRRWPVAELMLLAVAIFWGTSYGLTKEMLVFISVLGFLFVRFTLTFLALLPMFIRDYRRGLANDWQAAIPTGIILLAIFICETYGVFHTSAANAAFLISLCIIITPFAEWLVFKQRPSERLWVMAGLSVVGVALLTVPALEEIQFNRGDAFILCAALLRAAMVVMTKRVLKGKQLSALAITSIQSGVVMVGICLLLLATGFEWSQLLVSNSSFWMISLYLVAFCTIFAFYAQNYGVKHSTPSKVSLLMGSEPVFGALFAVAWLGEALTLWQWAGGALIVAATCYVAFERTE